jgi:hypothetical protein
MLFSEISWRPELHASFLTSHNHFLIDSPDWISSKVRDTRSRTRGRSWKRRLLFVWSDTHVFAVHDTMKTGESANPRRTEGFAAAVRCSTPV